MNKPSRNIQSLERALGLLEAIVAAGGQARLQQLANDNGLSKSTAHGMLDTLVALGYVSRVGTLYSVGLRLESLAIPARSAGDELREVFAPALQAGHELSGQQCVLAIASGTRTYLTLDGLDANRQPLALLPPNPTRDALTTSASGKVLIAQDRGLARRLRREGRLPAALENELRQVDAQGYAFDAEASEKGLNCLAIPLRHRGKVVAALGISGSARDFSVAHMHRFASTAVRRLFDVVKC
jgi:IclR family transcriptional regulator, acetate operon repressor